MTLLPTSQTESTTYFFTARELARLSVYRAAVVARFYTDQCEPQTLRSEIESRRLLESLRTEARAA